MGVALVTPRLRLREWRDADADAFAKMSAAPAMNEYLVPFAGRAAIDAWVAEARDHWRRHGFGRLHFHEIVAYTAVGNHRSRRVIDSGEDFDFLHPRLPAGHPLHRHLVYRIRALR